MGTLLQLSLGAPSFVNRPHTDCTAAGVGQDKWSAITVGQKQVPTTKSQAKNPPPGATSCGQPSSRAAPPVSHYHQDWLSIQVSGPRIRREYL
ncbi:GM17650 [Drosophila sechellia]|uniref:GM17650 n=1 Tax=Drosophila sechellia TaxID=7238 RepID=B4IG93_DROSE|nr:GM17650 [Drosophila sechellia]